MPFSAILQGLSASGGGGGGGFGGGGGGGVAQAIGQGISGIAAARSAQKISKLQARNNKLFTQINSRRISRQVRYQQGLAKTQNAGAGNSNNGSFLFVAADNARQGAERVNDEILRGRLQNIQLEANTPTTGDALVNFAGSLAGSVAQQNANNFKPQ